MTKSLSAPSKVTTVKKKTVVETPPFEGDSMASTKTSTAVAITKNGASHDAIANETTSTSHNNDNGSNKENHAFNFASLVGISNRTNSDYKWQRSRGIIGALEVASEPFLRLQDKFLQHSMQPAFQDALHVWKEHNLTASFVEACQSLPPDMCCCGMLRDGDASKKSWIPLLNEGWCRMVNKEFMAKRGFKVDAFLWNWQNASGKAETNILMIRFFQIATYRLRRASDEDSIDYSMLLGGSSKSFSFDVVPTVTSTESIGAAAAANSGVSKVKSAACAKVTSLTDSRGKRSDADGGMNPPEKLQPHQPRPSHEHDDDEEEVEETM